MPAMEDPSLAGLPRQLGKYTLIRRLATGGMAELFLAIQRSVGGFEKLIVIKRILPAMNQDEGFIEMLLHEARVAATLSHPNIVQVFDLGMADGTYFIAMEHAHGHDLRAIVRQMKRRGAIEFPLEHALSIVLGVCAGLAYAHEKRDLDGAPLDIVHRDISPQNVIVTFGGDVKVVDFGIAKSTGRVGDVTASGRLKGKVPYMSPEQARGETVDARSDVFAAGVMLFELTTGRRLFKAPSEYETFKLICERELPLPSRVRPGYPPALEAIVMRALARDRRERWQSARAMQVALEEFVREERIAAGRTGLAQFMGTLFAEEGALAGSGSDSSHLPSFGPMAARTVTDARVARTGGRSGVVVATVGLIALVAAVGAATGVVLSRAARREARETASDHEHVAAFAPEVPRAPAPIARSHGVLAIASSPPGAAIFVNGELSAATTPVTFTHVAIGAPCVLSLVAPGYHEAQRTVTLTNDDPSGALSVVLDPRRR